MSKVVITGGSGDIAGAIAAQMRGLGCEVFTPTRAELNVANIKSVQDYFAKTTPDILINNAGAIVLDAIAHNDIAAHKNVIDVNLAGVFACVGALLRANKNAKIVNIGSSAGTKIHANWSSYCATKAAVIMATACWAAEGIDAVCISPGRTLTKMRKSMYPCEDPASLMSPEDFAKAVVAIIQRGYERGANIDVNLHNVKEFINE